MRKLAGWLAILAMALQALWPLIAQARPATLVPICTVGGETHYIEIPAGDGAAAHEHCGLCLAGVALTAQPAPRFARLSALAPDSWSFESKSFLPIEADARDPPHLLMVHHNHYRRDHEEALALRAARPDLGGGVVRFGVLLG